MDLQALADRFQADFLGHRARIPFHEWRLDFKYFFTIQTNDLGLFGFLAPVGQVELVVPPDIDFLYQAAFRQNGEGSVNRGARYRAVEPPRKIEQVLRRKVFLLIENRVKDGDSLVGHPQTFLSEEFFEGLSGLSTVFGFDGVQGSFPPLIFNETNLRIAQLSIQSK